MHKKRSRIIGILGLTMAILLSTLPIGEHQASAATAFSDVSLNTTTPAVYEKLEVSFNLGTVYSNPFNPDEVDVRAYFTTPSGRIDVMPGFYKSNSSPNWAVRYAPKEIGNHTFHIKVIDSNGTGQTATYSFSSVSPGDNRGFMSVSGNRFVDSYGKQLTLLGTNYAWGSPPNILAAMPEYKAAKMNMMRVWLTVWWGNYAPEWGPVTSVQNGIAMTYEGVGRYQLENMTRMDTLMQTAEDNNIYINLVLNSFGDFHYNWDTNAYNKANGGPSYWSDNNTDFWTNPTAIAYQKKLLRYIFARWGYSRALGIMEYWNESDNHVDTSEENRNNWHAAVDNEWKSWDFYGRPTTTSFAWKDHSKHNKPSWEGLTTLDAVKLHWYDSSTSMIEKWEYELKNMLASFGNRPVFIGEYGRVHSDDSSYPDNLRYYHDGVWAPLFRAGAAGANMTWLFDQYTGVSSFNIPQAYKDLYTSLANFVQPEEQYLVNMPFTDYGLQGNSTKVGAFQNNNRVMLWINDTQALYDNASPRTINGMSFTVPNMANGTYDVTYYDTYTGTNISTTTVNVTNGNLVMNDIPSFTRDIAVKAALQGSGGSDTEAPTAPANLTSPSKTDTTVDLAWDASTDDIGVTGYDVYRGSTLAGSTTGATTFTVSGLEASTQYTFTVKARDAAGNVSTASNSVTVPTNEPVPDTEAPTAPGNLTSPSKTDTTVDLIWDASTDNVGVTGYDVYNGSTLAGSTTGATTITVTGLAASTTYTFTVKAKDAADNGSAASNSVTVTTHEPPPTGPNLLQNPGFEEDNGSGLPADWTCEKDYLCSRDTSVKRSGSSSMKVSATSGAWFAVHQSVAASAGNTYAFDGYLNIPTNSDSTVTVKVQFLNGSGSVLSEHTVATYTSTTSGFVQASGAFTAPANTANARAHVYFKQLNATIYLDDFSLSDSSDGGGGDPGDTESPTAPANLTSPSKTETTVDLAWDASTDNVGVTGYDVYNGSTLAGSTAGATTFTVTGLAASTAYTFTVKAKDAAGNVSAASNALSVTTNTPPDTEAPTAPANLTSPSKTDTTVDLAWDSSTDNVGVTGYDVYNGSTLAGSTTGATTFTVTGLAAGTAYSFTVKAMDAADNVSAASNALSVTTNAPPSQNLLQNPGFEEDNGSGLPADWTCEKDYLCSRDTSVKRSGSSSLKVAATSGAWFALHQSVAASAGNTYAFAGYLNIPNNSGTTVTVKVQFLNGSGSVLSEHTVATYTSTTSGFVQASGAYTAPANTANARVHVHFKQLDATNYLDDFSLTTN
jgi:chitodextrinase